MVIVNWVVFQAATAWALGQIGRHTPEHAKAVATASVLPTLLQLFLKNDGSDDLHEKVCMLHYIDHDGYIKTMNLQAKKALKNILTKCVYLPALEPLLHDAPPSILRHVVGQFSKVHIYHISQRKALDKYKINDQVI